MTDMTFASLSPTLLARKGGAKPAMRRQSPMISGAVADARAHPPGTPDNVPEEHLEDLGWNDLGESPEEAASPAPPPARDPAPSPAPNHHDNDGGEQASEEDFAPLARHAQSTAGEASPSATVTPIHKSAPRLPRPRLAASTTAEPPIEKKGKRTAFTLRLDPDRHLKLRVASTLAGTSAQVLVTQAVDAMFAGNKELEELVARIKSRPHQEG